MERRTLDKDLVNLLLNPKGRRFAVVGLGEQAGVSAANFLALRGAEVLASDIKKAEDLREALSRLDPRVRVETGGHSETLFHHAEAALLAPGLPPEAPVARRLREMGIPVLGEAQLACLYLKGTMVGITGTKGKSSTTSLVALGGGAAFAPSRAGGNLPPPALDLVEDSRPEGLSVLELSSFQLALSKSLPLAAAALTNFGADHLDRYAGLADYKADKLRIVEGLGRRGTLVLPWGDGAAADFKKAHEGPLLWFGTGEDLPEGFLVRGGLMIRRAGGKESRYDLPRDGILASPHQRLNLACALALLQALGLEPDLALSRVKDFKGLPGRTENLGRSRGLLFINDSQGTDLLALAAAIKAATPPVRLLVGGIFKGGEPAELGPLLSGRVAKVYAYGRDGGVFLKAWSGSVEGRACEDLRQAFLAATAEAREGETLLLSPACSSFDQFKSAKQRGELFRGLVADWMAGRGAS